MAQPEQSLSEAPYFKRVIENIERVRVLIAGARTAHEAPERSGPRFRLATDDLVRMTVVFTHATLEDYLRTLASKILPDLDKSVLADVPLAGLNIHGRAEKFNLGDLAKSRGKTVDQVIQESVLQDLDRSSFNQLKDIADLMRKLGLADSEYQLPSFSKIDQLMKRRHQIVHRGDRQGLSDTFDQPPQDIDLQEVEEWNKAVEEFILKSVDSVFAHDRVNRLFKFGILTETEYLKLLRNQ